MNNKEYSHSQTEKKRLFFALWPDDGVVQQIKQQVLPLFSRCKGRILHAHNWHITLAYFGMADSKTQRCLEQQAQTLLAQPFAVELQLTGLWSRPQVAWLAPKEKPAALVHLVQDLQQALIPCGYMPESRDYQPHITLVRKAKQAPSRAEITSLKMEVKQFCLVESQTTAQGANYRVLKRWDFSPGPL